MIEKYIREPNEPRYFPTNPNDKNLIKENFRFTGSVWEKAILELMFSQVVLAPITSCIGVPPQFEQYPVPTTCSLRNLIGKIQLMMLGRVSVHSKISHFN